jgi:predicted MFS family arabinose efflux permease
MSEDRVQHSRAWLATIILAMAALICSADKSLPGLLMEPIKHAMSLSDTQIGVLTGFTFAISMSLAAFPLAWLADRYDRTMLLAIAIAAWCLLTVASGFAHDFTTLFLCRLGVGIGEAALMPASLSLIGDLFPLRRVARASAIMTYAGISGTFIAMAGGGALYDGFHAAALAGTLPLAPEDARRWTTIIFGAAGLIVAVLVGTILPEPRRTKPASIAATGPVADFGSYLRAATPFLLIFLLFSGASAIFISGFNVWMAPFFSRTFGWSIGEVGRVVGAVLLIGGLAGPAIGFFFHGLVRKWLGREAPVLTICVMLSIALPFVVGGPFMPTGLGAAVAVGIVAAIAAGSGIAMSVVFVSIAPSHLRARLIAVLILFGGLIGSTGSFLYGAFTDHVLGDPSKIYITMSLLSGTLVLITIVAGVFADRRYREIIVMARDAELPAG